MLDGVPPTMNNERFSKIAIINIESKLLTVLV